MGDALLDAWAAHEAFGHRLTKLYADAIAKDRMPWVPLNYGTPEANALVDATAAVAADLGITSLHLSRSMQAYRRAGLSREGALEAITHAAH